MEQIPGGAAGGYPGAPVAKGEARALERSIIMLRVRAARAEAVFCVSKTAMRFMRGVSAIISLGGGKPTQGFRSYASAVSKGYAPQTALFRVRRGTPRPPRPNIQHSDLRQKII
ncbi:MAG: hypothetical protein COT18_10190 [Elusimicrobia bacterium CG08_land_8_20_14_0_20_59_10]|nr:MAG: hypothetical protein COT18_10190 [Elusimicrobia bacterium CG08_land_8_20_14_0_20_59_10]